MFDSFTEMPPPDERDTHVSGKDGPESFAEVIEGERAYDLLPLDRVRALPKDTGYPPERLHFVPGLLNDRLQPDVAAGLALRLAPCPSHSRSPHSPSPARS